MGFLLRGHGKSVLLYSNSEGSSLNTVVLKWTMVILVGVGLLGAVVGAAASLTVSGVDKLGSGSATVDAPAGVEVTDVRWTLDTDITKVRKVEVSFAAVVPSVTADVTLQLRDDFGVIRNALFVDVFIDGGFGDTTVVWNLLADGGSIPAADITGFDITVIQEIPP